MPAGELVTVPVPAPAGTTVNDSVGARVNEADTVVTDDIVTLQAPVPVQAPPQPANTEPETGVAVRLTEVPAA